MTHRNAQAAVVASLGVLLAGWGARSLAAEATPVDQIEVTATRTPEPADQVPVYITVIPGKDLRARAVTDLRGALALVGGVEAPSGGDAGPAGAVPSLWGLHEFDAFLLVVDGVPLGGAFNPAIPDLDLTNVERIEVLKGAAPVVFGATAFVGVIQVIHYPAGKADRHISAGYGEHGSWSASGAVVLPALGPISQSLSLSGKRDGYADKREHVGQFHGLYRAGGDIGGGALRVDLGVDTTRSVPPSPVPRIDGALTTLTPLDANYNPTDARIDETRYHGVIGYEHPTPLGVWSATASLTCAASCAPIWSMPTPRCRRARSSTTISTATSTANWGPTRP
jgi:outer membrane receptor protein involved in Fe transport